MSSALHLYTPPEHVAEYLRARGWPDRPSFDEVELAGQVLRSGVAAWADRIVAGMNMTMPATSGLAVVDDDGCIIGVGLSSGRIVGSTSGALVGGLDRADACFTLRALDEGYTRVRPMPLLPLAIIDPIAGCYADGRPIIAAGAPVEIPEGARVFVEVDPAQRDVVYDVWAVAPSDAGLAIWRRHDEQWEDDPGWLSVLYGEALPTLIHMAPDDPVFVSIVEQVDESTAGEMFKPLTASVTLSPEIYTDLLPLIARGTRGGLKRAAGVGRGGNAETLRRYWAEGEGAAKIRWGVGGDWYRCVKHLRKYMGVRAKGYCNLIHKRALGYYPSTHAKMVREGKDGHRG